MLDEPNKITEQSKKSLVAVENWCQRIRRTQVVSAHTFERQVHAVTDLGTEAAQTIDRESLPRLDSSRPDHHPAYRVSECSEMLMFLFWNVGQDVMHPSPASERWDHTIAREVKLAQFGSVIKVL